MTLGEIQPDLIREFAKLGAAAIFCGGLIGLERQLLNKPAGLRVCILVVFTTAFFIALVDTITDDEAAHARVLAGVITGIGFLGAGVIFRGGGQVSGLTTATLIWALAAIGSTIGFGLTGVAVVATISIMIVLGLVDLAEYLFPGLRREQDVANSARSASNNR